MDVTWPLTRIWGPYSEIMSFGLPSLHMMINFPCVTFPFPAPTMKSPDSRIFRAVTPPLYKWLFRPFSPFRGFLPTQQARVGPDAGGPRRSILSQLNPSTLGRLRRTLTMSPVEVPQYAYSSWPSIWYSINLNVFIMVLFMTNSQAVTFPMHRQRRYPLYTHHNW